MSSSEAAVEVDVNDDDDEWYEWAISKMREKPSWTQYEAIMRRCIEVARGRWRTRFNKETWIRVMKKDRLIKELNEIAPVLDRVVRELNSPAYDGKQTTVIDLCSGFGYFGMFIAELVPSERLDRICLVDNAWPEYGKAPKPHHINHKVGYVVFCLSVASSSLLHPFLLCIGSILLIMNGPLRYTAAKSISRNRTISETSRSK
jgi:hypothetical protein